MPFAVLVLVDKSAAVAPDPGREIVGNVPVALARECVAADLGTVFEQFTAFVHFADGVRESLVVADAGWRYAVLLHDALVAEYGPHVDEPRDGENVRVAVYMGGVPRDGHESCGVDLLEDFVQA